MIRLSLVLLLSIPICLPARADNPQIIGGRVEANFNVTTDTSMCVRASKYVIRKITVTNCSASMTLAAGGVYTGASKAGTAVVASTQVYSALTTAAKYLDLTLAAAAATDVFTAACLNLSLTVAQGAAATCDVYVFGDVLP